ncbi:General substrate transporter [Niveomyces insectorum RCEF 264]|uniref:General substrate transporter n=1 Tax=Niveomyces insectorum RCEF 264 TaxID=1081102 RepID=A0A162MT92_9HYPO|nr:General substrate transporter [Niveomyces insectorum RCEF 264]
MHIIDQSIYKETPKEAVSWKILTFAIILSFSGALHGFNTSNISGVLAMASFKSHFELKGLSTQAAANWTGWITSVLLLGSCCGSLICSPVTDRLGRRWSLALFTAIFVVSAILMSANPGGSGGRAEFLVGRILSGVGSGAASVIGTGYMAEISPKAIRGGLTALYNANTMLSVGLGYWINYGSLQHIKTGTNEQWQVPMGVQALPGVVLLVGLLFIPESPRWLGNRGKLAEAKASLTRLRSLPGDHPFVQQEFSEICSAIEEEQAVRPGVRGLLSELVSPDIRKRLLMVMIIQVGFQFSGGNIITYYNTSILTSIGLTSSSTNYLFSGIYGIVKFVTVVLYCLFVVDRLGRRTGLFAGSALIIVSLTYLTVYLAVANPTQNAAHGTGAAGWVAVVFIYIFAIGYAISWGTIPWIINAEVFPNRVRSVCMSICITWTWLVNFALTRAQPNMVITMHAWGPFLLFLCVTTVLTGYCFFAYPETRKLSMERMDELFTMPWYRVGRASVRLIAAEAALTDGHGEKGFEGALDENEKTVAEPKN